MELLSSGSEPRPHAAAAAAAAGTTPSRRRQPKHAHAASDDSKSVINSAVNARMGSSRVPTVVTSSSLPVSIPLAHVDGAAAAVAAAANRQVARVARSAAAAYDSYSPISRPGSSSSTASAESVRAFMHEPPVPPPHDVTPSQHKSRSAAGGATARPGSVPVTDTDVKPRSLPPASAGLGLYSGYPNVGAMLLNSPYAYAASPLTSANRQLYDKMFVGGSGYPSSAALFSAQFEAASLMYQQQLNGLSKPSADVTRRERADNSKSSGDVMRRERSDGSKQRGRHTEPFRDSHKSGTPLQRYASF